jgi:hypothetical protein
MKDFYQLICTYEMSTNVVGIYDSYEEAYEAMLEDFASVVEYSVDALNEYLEKVSGDADITDWCAWTSNRGDNCNWAILCLRYTGKNLINIMPL